MIPLEKVIRIYIYTLTKIKTSPLEKAIRICIYTLMKLE